MRNLSLALCACFICAVQCRVRDLRIAIVTDTHIGEACNGDLSYDACKPVRTLTEAVEKINSMSPAIDAVFVSGDITSSALHEEFVKSADILSALIPPCFPILGNHDSWPYERHSDGSFNQTETPIGDQYFAEVFGSLLKDGPKGNRGDAIVSGWPTGTCLNGDFGFQSWHHNYMVQFNSFPGLVILGLDWTARGDALPEPGVGPEAELHDYPCGTTDWLSQQLGPLSTASADAVNTTRFFIVQHHPFHNRDVLDPAGKNRFYNFTFDDKQDARVQSLLDDYFPPSAFLGIQAGHMHRWFNGSAFTKFTAIDDEWAAVPEWETSACKGWAYGEDFVSAISVFHFQRDDETDVPVLGDVRTFWKIPSGEWRTREEYEA